MNKLKSRKLWITAISAFLVSILTQVGLPVEIASAIIGGIAGSYNIGQGIADAGAGKSQTSEQ